jgi:hypothetical protein
MRTRSTLHCFNNLPRSTDRCCFDFDKRTGIAVPPWWTFFTSFWAHDLRNLGERATWTWEWVCSAVRAVVTNRTDVIAREGQVVVGVNLKQTSRPTETISEIRCKKDGRYIFHGSGNLCEEPNLHMCNLSKTTPKPNLNLFLPVKKVCSLKILR